MTRKRALLVLSIVILAIGLWLYGSSSTPPGQSPLVSLHDGNVVQFEQRFNAAVSDTRVVLLLSPT